METGRRTTVQRSSEKEGKEWTTGRHCWLGQEQVESSRQEIIQWYHEYEIYATNIRFAQTSGGAPTIHAPRRQCRIGGRNHHPQPLRHGHGSGHVRYHYHGTTFVWRVSSRRRTNVSTIRGGRGAQRRHTETQAVRQVVVQICFCFVKSTCGTSRDFTFVWLFLASLRPESHPLETFPRAHRRFTEQLLGMPGAIMDKGFQRSRSVRRVSAYGFTCQFKVLALLSFRFLNATVNSIFPRETDHGDISRISIQCLSPISSPSIHNKVVKC